MPFIRELQAVIVIYCPALRLNSSLLRNVLSFYERMGTVNSAAQIVLGMVACRKLEKHVVVEKKGRGCGANHLGHEFFCHGAKLCFSTQMETVLRADGESEEKVLLQVMKIPGLYSDNSVDIVFWDTACTGYFVWQGSSRQGV